MKIKLQGNRTTAELRQMVHRAVDELEALGVTHVRGGNLYLTPVDDEGREVRARRNSRNVKELTIKGPYPCAADKYCA